MGNEGYGMGLVRSTSFGRKRVALSEAVFDDDCYMLLATPLNKRQCLQDSIFDTDDKSAIEDLPQEILIRILCGVEHDDLKSLFFVSKAIRDATLIAKELHFAYSTPQKTVGFRNAADFLSDFSEVEPPNAPKQTRIPRSRLSAKKLADISVALFPSDGEKNWPRTDLYMGME